MRKTKYSHKVIAVFFTLNFLTTIIPVNQLYANNNGPNSPEVAGFEPVDATDMVNLSTGDLSYVLPLMSVEGFPVSLSYHAGMTADMDASWVGLGWYLNPGAINRSLTNTPDDWKGGVGINFNSFNQETDYYGITADVGLWEGAGSIGVGMNWGGGKGISGSVSASLGPLSAFADTNGYRDVSVGAKVLEKSLGPVSGSVNLSYSLKNQWSLSGGVGYKDKKGNSYVGASYSSSGAFSIGGKSGSDKNGVKGGSIGMNADSFSSGDASVDQQSTGVSLPLQIVGIPIRLGFKKTKVKINIKKGFINNEWGALYSIDFHTVNQSSLSDGVAKIVDVANYNEGFNDYVVRTKSMDTYSTRIPQEEANFISDYSKDIENINFTFMGYDNYNVAAHGIMGNMTPRVFKNATIFGKGQRTKNQNGDNIHVFWHHGKNENAVDRQLGRLYGTDQSYNSNDFYFYFDGQFTSTEKNDVWSMLPNNVNNSNFIDVNDLISEDKRTSSFNSSSGREKSPNYIEVFTNKQIANGHATARGLITPASIPNTDRDDINKFDPDGIGAYMITSPDGKTHHFSLPVYHFEEVQRGQINTQENFAFDIANVNEKRQFSRYATHWLLTAITGSDFVDRPDPNLGGVFNTFNKEDFGYWVELEYGKWSDGYVWRTPYKDRLYQYSTNLKNKIEDKDKGGYSFGRKQIYYIDKINTKNKTALFVKDIRFDAIGKNLKFMYSNSGQEHLGHTGDGNNPASLKYTDGGVYVQENKLRPGTTNKRGVEYAREYTLKLSKIVLVNSEVGKNLSKNTTGASLYSGYTPNGIHAPNWESPYFSSIYGSNYTYPIHNEKEILDVNDVTSTFISENALKVVELNHSYNLAKKSPSSEHAPISMNPQKGRLTLESVQIKGKGGAVYMPPTSFDYYLKDMNNISLNTFSNTTSPSSSQIKTYLDDRALLVDDWGFLQGEESENGVIHNKIKAWSLKNISMPTGAKIEIDYEEDEYWTEAFSRRYWQDNLEFKVHSDASYWDVYVRNQLGILPQLNIDFSKYFQLNEKAFLDLWICHKRKYSGNYKESWFDLNPGNNNNAACTVLEVNQDQIKLRIPKNLTNYDVQDWNDSDIGFVTRWFHNDGLEAGNHLRGQCPEQMQNGQKHHYISHRLLANKVPENETGGGLRVKELRTKDLDKAYKVTYDYNHPTKNRSSGITSYAPVNGLKFVPYQSEIPAPGVMYEYVTMKESSTDTNDYYSKTRYRHHVLKPVFNIFNSNIEMEALGANSSGEDKIFWAKVTDNYGNLNGSNAKKVKAKKIDININTALIGQIKSIENINSKGHIMLKSDNEYINGTILANQEPNKGYVKETFNSMKTIFKASNDGTIIYDANRLLSISSKTEYNNMLKKTTTIAGSQKSSIEYSDVDPWLSSFRKSKTTLADGTYKMSTRVPAYEKYPSMQSKVLNPNNKNMLTQEAMNISFWSQYGNAFGWETLDANITTWNDSWTYRDTQGNETKESGVWRKHKSFVWKDDINSVRGTYVTPVDNSQDYFNWEAGVPTNEKWQNISEITRYTHWSSPIETKDINGNYLSSKMAEIDSKVIAGGNASFTELFASGAEYSVDGTYLDQEIKGAKYRTADAAHTGSHSLKIGSGNKGFETKLKANEHSEGVYKISVWVDYSRAALITRVNINGVSKPFNGEVVKAGNWTQLNHYEPFSKVEQNVYVTVDDHYSSITTHVDDFRIHPVYSSMNTYVYDQNTDELIYVLDANNMGTKYEYDDAGRLEKTYKEVEADLPATDGGFKLMNQYKYNYKTASTARVGSERRR